ncbi:MAG: Hsp20/alpha crystallin family protein [Paludibacteraceae bacterium]|nr:Hsp20/alpha crystallin family protein [Paludibacteraceae bacterium]
MKNDWMFGNPMFGKMFEVKWGAPMPPHFGRPMCHPHHHHEHPCHPEHMCHPMPAHHPHHPFPWGGHNPFECGCAKRHEKGHLRVNVIENEAEYVIELCVPGRAKEDLNLYVEAELLHVETVEKDPCASDVQTNYLKRGFVLKPVKEVFELPEDADMEKVSAKVENGILTVVVAKRDKSGEIKKIEIA